MRLPESSYEIQHGRWYLIQFALSFITCGVLAFIEIPTELSWAMWRTHARASTQPDCYTSLDSIISVHNWINVAVVSLGIFAPFLLLLSARLCPCLEKIHGMRLQGGGEESPKPLSTQEKPHAVHCP
jgi:hypothetical protein